MQTEADPDARWVEALSGSSAADVRAALDKAIGERRLFGHLSREHAAEGRRRYGEIDAPLELYALVRLRRPRHVVEVGVSSGVSSAYLLAALDRNSHGTLHSVDLPAKPRSRRSGGPIRESWSLPAGRSSGWAVPLPLRARWDLRLGDKARVLPLLREELPSVDLFVYDVPHWDTVALEEFRRLDPLLPRGAVAIVDHGPGGELCPSLKRWADERGGTPIGRVGTGLFGMRCRRATARARPSRPVP